MKELQELNEELHSKINSLSKNLVNFVEETSSLGLGSELPVLCRGITLLKSNISRLLSEVAIPPNKAVMELSRELEMVKVKYVSLQKEWESQQEHLGRLQGDMFSLRNQLRMQSSFCASLGSTLGNLLWKVSRIQPAIELLISSNKLPELFSMVNGTLASFLETYAGSGLPELFSDETQFILSMVGVVANVAAVPEGRQLLVSEQEGKDLLEQIVHSLTVVPLATGDPLLRILLMVAYNASINEGGLALLQDKKPLLLTTSEIIACDRSPDLRLIALRLLDSLTFHYPTIPILNLHKAVLPHMKLNSIAAGADAEMRGYAQSILNNFEKGRELLRLETSMPQDYLSQADTKIR